jgi:hypothetical protein
MARAGDPPYLQCYARSMYRREDLRRGSFWGCKRCNDLFYLDDNSSIMYYIGSEKAEMYRRFAQTPPTLSDALYSKAESLIPINGDVGCRVKTTRGEVVELAEIKFAHFPEAIFWVDGSPRLCTEIGEIDSSPYALPHSIRRASYSAKDIMVGDECVGHEPTPIESPHGRVFLLAEFSTFFAYKHLRGCDMQLSTKCPPYWSILGPPIKYRFPSDLVTTFLADPRPH